jgi:hypothetical protein
VAILTFVALSVAFVLIANPYTAGNLRQTFLPVVFVLLYAAYGAYLVMRYTVRNLSSNYRRVALGCATVAMAGVIAILAARNTVRFVGVSADEIDFRLPSAIGRWFAQIPVEGRRQVHIVSLLDNADNLVVALYAQLPVSSVKAVTDGLPAGTTHVVYIPRPDKSLSDDAEVLNRRLQTGTIRADMTRIEAAAVWTLQMPAR